MAWSTPTPVRKRRTCMWNEGAGQLLLDLWDQGAGQLLSTCGIRWRARFSSTFGKGSGDGSASPGPVGSRFGFSSTCGISFSSTCGKRLKFS